MTPKQFFDWQTSGGTDDVMRLVDALERADLAWCIIGGIAVNHWSEEEMVTRDVDLVVSSDSTERAIQALEEAGFRAERHEWSVNFAGSSGVSLQLSTEPFYDGYPERSVAADVHGILLRVANLEDTVRGKVKAWREPTRRKSKRIKDLADLARLVEAHPEARDLLPDDVKAQLDRT